MLDSSRPGYRAAKPAAARGELLDLWEGLGQPTLANSVAQIHRRATYRSEPALGKRNAIDGTPFFRAFVDFSERFRAPEETAGAPLLTNEHRARTEPSR